MWLTAHHGVGVALGAGPRGMTAALSSRSDGPMVFGTARLKFAIDPGRHVRVASGHGEYVMHFLGRAPSGSATYVLAHARVWCGRSD